MMIRKIAPQEQIDVLKMLSLVFAYKSDLSRAETQPQDYSKDYELTRALFDNQCKMCSCLSYLPFEMIFDRHVVKMGGIGNVASLPEERNDGNIRKLIRYAFEEMLDNGQIFSYLHPFSAYYYRKFGYECCNKTISASISFKSFKYFKKYGRIEMLVPLQNRKDIVNIYNRFIQDKNLAMVRNEKQWNNLIDKDPYATRQYTYILYDDADQPASYISFSPDPQNENHMQVLELIWTNYESLTGILHFLQYFSSRFELFKCVFPEFLNLHLLFPEPLDIKAEVSVSGMSRIVSLPKVLELISYPEESGRFTICVHDSFLEWNTGTYQITWEPDGVKVIKEEGPADLSCNIEVLTQLITGYAGIDDYTGNKALAVYNQKDLLSMVFHKKKTFMNDLF